MLRLIVSLLILGSNVVNLIIIFMHYMFMVILLLFLYELMI